MTHQELHQILSRFGLENLKNAVAGAVVVGILASMILIPIISTVTGATAGAALGAYKSIGKR
jgi:hypothetical protein